MYTYILSPITSMKVYLELTVDSPDKKCLRISNTIHLYVLDTQYTLFSLSKYCIY